MPHYEIKHIEQHTNDKGQVAALSSHILVLHFKKIPFYNLLPHHSYIKNNKSTIFTSIHYVVPTSDSYQSHLAE